MNLILKTTATFVILYSSFLCSEENIKNINHLPLCKFNNAVHCYGELIFMNGNYTGEIMNNIPNGFGKCFWKETQQFYIGDFKNGIFEGQGEYHYKGGGYYKGSFLNNKPHGYGYFIHPNGLKERDGKWEYGNYVYPASNDSDQIADEKIIRNQDEILKNQQKILELQENAIKQQQSQELINNGLKLLNGNSTTTCYPTPGVPNSAYCVK